MKIIGHRGAKGLAPENTVRGFEKALEHNVDEIELDVRITKDGVPALLHDPFLKDRAGNELEIKNHSFAELLKHKPDLTTLDVALRAINRRVPVIIEIKPKVPIEQIVAVLKRLLQDGWRNEDFTIASFDYKLLKQIHRELPAIQKVVNEGWSGARGTWRARQLNTKRLSMRSWWLWRGFLVPMHRRGWEISPYTMNDPVQTKKWRKYLYGAITDYPDLYGD